MSVDGPSGPDRIGGISSRKVRVLHLADGVNRYDFIDNVVRHLDPDRFSVGVATFTDESNIAPPLYADAGIPHWVLDNRSRAAEPLTALRLAALLRRERFDIVHTHHYDSALVGWAATRLARETRLVVGRHYLDAIHRYATGWRRRGLLAAEAVVNRGARRIVVPAQLVADFMVEVQAVPADAITVIPYAFDPTRYQRPSLAEISRMRLELGLDGRFALGTFARLHLAHKGHLDILEALRALAADRPELVWVVVGDGPDRARLESALATAGLGERVRMLGWRHDVVQVMTAVDAVVQPSLEDAFGQVMVEALWMERPLVLSTACGAAELLADGESALVVPPGDPDALAEALRRLLADPSLREHLASAGRRVVEAELTIDRVVPRFEALYAEVARC